MVDEMKEKKINYWLQEGKQSKITPAIKKIANNFKGDELDKIMQICEWIDKNVPFNWEYKKTIKIFANRTADKIIRDKFNVGCHDVAVLTATFLRALKIPARFIEGVNKLKPENQGHCVVEAYVKNRWILIDSVLFLIHMMPSRSDFYKENYITGIGLDSWDNNEKTFDDWKKVSQKVINHIKKIK